MPDRTPGSILRSFAADFFANELKAWRGEEPLWKVFWGYGVCVSGLLALLYAAAIQAERAALQQLLLVGFAAYTVWILVSVWRCAKNTREKFWSLIARALTVAWAGNTIMVLMFLQLDLVTKYLAD